MAIQVEIDRLRSYLTSVGYDYNAVYSICDHFTQVLNESVFDVVSGAVDEALDHAINIGADEFVNDIQVLPDANGYYSISSHSGTLDYSTKSVQMLPHLLKNAKISSDGSRHKVIPVRGKTESSMFSMLQSKQDTIDNARTAMRNRAKERRAEITSSLQEYASQRSRAMSSISEPVEPNSGQVNFRTASDKQDPNTSWVIPGKDADMTSYIYELNSRILTMSEQAVSDVASSFYQEYGG